MSCNTHGKIFKGNDVGKFQTKITSTISDVKYEIWMKWHVWFEIIGYTKFDIMGLLGDVAKTP